jgi:hypothetical protein
MECNIFDSTEWVIEILQKMKLDFPTFDESKRFIFPSNQEDTNRKCFVMWAMVISAE